MVPRGVAASSTLPAAGAASDTRIVPTTGTAGRRDLSGSAGHHLPWIWRETFSRAGGTATSTAIATSVSTAVPAAARRWPWEL